MHHIVAPGFVDRPRRSDCTAGQMDGEAGWWTTSGNIGLPPLARVMGVGTQQHYNYNKADFSAMITFMRSINWKDELCGKNVERSWLMITNMVDQCKKQYVPKMRKGKKMKPSWMDNRAHKAQKRKHKSYDRQKRESSDKNREDYKKALNIFTREARRSKEKFERKMAENIIILFICEIKITNQA